MSCGINITYITMEGIDIVLIICIFYLLVCVYRSYDTFLADTYINIPVVLHKAL